MAGTRGAFGRRILERLCDDDAAERDDEAMVDQRAEAVSSPIPAAVRVAKV